MVIVSKFPINTMVELESTNISSKECMLSGIKLRLVTPLRGGKSGDSVFIVTNGRKRYVLKVFAKDAANEKPNKEIGFHSKFMRLFNPSYIPCPAIYLYGRLTGESPFKGGKINHSLEFMIMDALTPMYELDQFIRELCANRLTRRVDMINILYQLFHILSVMRLGGIMHCDLHTKNIMVIPTKKKTSIDFSYIGGGVVPISAYTVKILDFGEGSSDSKGCRKCRTLSGALYDLKQSCITRRMLYTKVVDRMLLLKGQLPNFYCKGDVDMNFFCVILEIMQLADERIRAVDVNKFWSVATSGKITKSALADLFAELSKVGKGGWRRTAVSHL